MKQRWHRADTHHTCSDTLPWAACLLLIFFSVQTGCSGDKRVGKDELSSQLSLGVSLASEAELFIEYVREGRATTSYAQGHAMYLAEELDDCLVALNGRSEPSLSKQTEQSRRDFAELRREVAHIRGAIGGDSELNAAKNRIAQLHGQLAAIKSSL
jgi:hypothetical protein